MTVGVATGELGVTFGGEVGVVFIAAVGVVISVVLLWFGSGSDFVCAEVIASFGAKVGAGVLGSDGEVVASLDAKLGVGVLGSDVGGTLGAMALEAA